MPCCSIAFLSCNKNTWSNEHVIDSSISNSSNSLESTFWSSALIQAPFDRGLAGPFFLGCKRQNKKHRSKLKSKQTCAQKVTSSFARGQGSHTCLAAGDIEEKDVFLSPMPPMLTAKPRHLLRCDKCECDEWESKVNTKSKHKSNCRRTVIVFFLGEGTRFRQHPTHAGDLIKAKEKEKEKQRQRKWKIKVKANVHTK